jgi:hypothetical protein
VLSQYDARSSLSHTSHQKPDSLTGCIFRVENPDDPAFVHYGNAIAKCQHLVKLGAYDQDCGPCISLLNDSSVNVFN